MRKLWWTLGFLFLMATGILIIAAIFQFGQLDALVEVIAAGICGVLAYLCFRRLEKN